MSSYLTGSTSTALIDRVRARDADAWTRMARLYTPLVYRWARQCGMQSNDAADVVQEVFLAVAGHIEGFSKSEPGSSFRGWLWTIARNQIRLHFRKQKDRPHAAGGTDAHRKLEGVADMLAQDEEPSATDSRKSLVHRALESIRQDFQPATWQAFVRLTLESQSAAAVAEELGMTAAAVRQAKYRVLCRLHDELDRC